MLKNKGDRELDNMPGMARHVHGYNFSFAFGHLFHASSNIMVFSYQALDILNSETDFCGYALGKKEMVIYIIILSRCAGNAKISFQQPVKNAIQRGTWCRIEGSKANFIINKAACHMDNQ